MALVGAGCAAGCRVRNFPSSPPIPLPASPPQYHPIKEGVRIVTKMGKQIDRGRFRNCEAPHRHLAVWTTFVLAPIMRNSELSWTCLARTETMTQISDLNICSRKHLEYVLHDALFAFLKHFFKYDLTRYCVAWCIRLNPLHRNGVAQKNRCVHGDG